MESIFNKPVDEEIKDLNNNLANNIDSLRNACLFYKTTTKNNVTVSANGTYTAEVYATSYSGYTCLGAVVKTSNGSLIGGWGGDILTVHNYHSSSQTTNITITFIYKKNT